MTSPPASISIVNPPDTSARRRRDRLVYIAGDFASAWVAWLLTVGVAGGLWKGLLVAFGWTAVYALFDQYRDIYRISRLEALMHTIAFSVVGALITGGNPAYLMVAHFLLTAFSRMLLLTLASRRLKRGKVSFNTLIIGGGAEALELYREIAGRPKGLGNRFIGFVDTQRRQTPPLGMSLPRLGDFRQLSEVIENLNVEEVIIAVDTSQHNRIRELLSVLDGYRDRVLVKIIPDMYDIMLGTVKMNHVFGAVLIEIRQELMPKWQRVTKRVCDVLASAVVLLLLSPVYAYIALRVRLSSKGPILYRQERIGMSGNPFTILKFRSMYTDAEKDGPRLSSDSDDRCTPWGAVMRKWRLDELPQFWNVLRGDMSLVGPRPERQYFIERITVRAPHYRHLLKVRPGITSWGMVKYGYASNVDEMIARLKFDILYIENRSLALDLKIMFYTLVVLLQGKGK